MLSLLRIKKRGVEKMNKAKDIIQDAIDKYLKDMVEEEVNLSKITEKNIEELPDNKALVFYSKKGLPFSIMHYYEVKDFIGIPTVMTVVDKFWIADFTGTYHHDCDAKTVLAMARGFAQ